MGIAGELILERPFTVGVIKPDRPWLTCKSQLAARIVTRDADVENATGGISIQEIRDELFQRRWKRCDPPNSYALTAMNRRNTVKPVAAYGSLTRLVQRQRSLPALVGRPRGKLRAEAEYRHSLGPRPV